MKNIILIGITSVCLAGCVTMGEWQRMNTSEAQREQDMKECRYDADKATINLPAFDKGWDGAVLFRQCMEVRGYEQKPQ